MIEEHLLRNSPAQPGVPPIPSISEGQPALRGQLKNAFSVDLEDYFHPSEVGVSADHWSSLAPRIEVGTNLLLDLFAAHGVRATFFVLGWVAERDPELVRRVARAGHEIG